MIYIYLGSILKDSGLGVPLGEGLGCGITDID
jgi:hypothetical protein